MKKFILTLVACCICTGSFASGETNHVYRNTQTDCLNFAYSAKDALRSIATAAYEWKGPSMPSDRDLTYNAWLVSKSDQLFYGELIAGKAWAELYYERMLQGIIPRSDQEVNDLIAIAKDLIEPKRDENNKVYARRMLALVDDITKNLDSYCSI